jgi:hypothetical protein
VSSDETAQRVHLEARLSLFGFVATPADLLVSPRSETQRVTRTVLTIAATILLAPLLFLIPPHIEWLVMTTLTGIYWARKNWTAEYVVASFSGTCPRCYAAISINAGTTLRLPHSVVCYSCHEHPSLEAGGAAPVDEANRVDNTEPDRPVGERRPFRIWSPAGSDW